MIIGKLFCTSFFPDVIVSEWKSELLSRISHNEKPHNIVSIPNCCSNNKRLTKFTDFITLLESSAIIEWMPYKFYTRVRDYVRTTHNEPDSGLQNRIN